MTGASHPAAARARQSAGTALVRTTLAVAVVLGSLVLWLAVPGGWLLIASELGDTYRFVYLVTLLACPATMVLWAVVLKRINDRYVRLAHPDSAPRSRSPWLRSVSGERGATARPGSLLDGAMAVSVVLAVVVLVLWFFFFAGSSLPSA